MKYFFYFLTFLIIIGIVSAYALIRLLNYTSPTPSVLYFGKGSSLRSISQQLEEANVIPNAFFFEALARLRKNEKQIHAGEYEFKAGLTPTQVLEMLTEGKVKLYPLTIPEGYNLKEIGKVLVSKNLTTFEEWNLLSKDTSFLKSLNVKAESLEGYLFPDTYMLERKTTITQLINSMVTLFKFQISKEMLHKANQAGFDLHQWVTLASIIEKETGVSQERPQIASVFLNRLKKGMLLQTDPTVIYGMKNYNGNITKQDLITDTPYNTYTRAGLPPGPICSPGLESLKAVIEPATTDYLFFVGKGDGSHYFSKTLEEHNRAVTYYQLKHGSPP